jgi:hypothetical protein
MTGGVRGKYADAYRRSHHLVRLDPDVAKAFTTDAAVNEALRAVLRAAAAISGSAFDGEGTSGARVSPRS